ncbi:glycosyltransferase family 4 protein [soil metagenome]
MKILYGVQRYGEEVGGGAESACRSLAEHMADRGHHVEVITSCVVDYVTWADEYPVGTSEVNGVTVHRLPVRSERTTAQFGPLSHRVLTRPQAPLAVEQDWVRVQGPDLPGLEPWLSAEAGRFDVAAFYTYLYPTSATGLPIAARSTATVLHPAAHDEPMIELSVFDALFRQADGICVHTLEELETVRRRFHFDPLAEVVGLGVEIHPAPADGGRFRAAHGLTDEPILLYNGRVEPGKGTDELVRYFIQFRERYPGAIKLVLVGPLITPVDEHPDVICTGYVDEQTRLDAYAASFAFVMPSYFESFSIALCDAWVIRRAALINADCAVLDGQARRSRAAIGYRNLAEFSAALMRLIADPPLREAMGESGRDFVVENYSWDAVAATYERFLHRTIDARRQRLRVG